MVFSGYHRPCQRRYLSLELHRQRVFPALAVVGGVDGINVPPPARKLGGVIPADTVELHGMDAAQRCTAHDSVFQGVQPHLGQYFKGWAGLIQVVETRLRFSLDQYPFDLRIGRSVNVTPLDLPLRCARLDVPAFPPTVLTLANAFSPSRHRCFLLLFRPSSDPLIFSIFVYNWNYYTELGKKQKQFGLRDVFSGSNVIHL